MSQVLLVVSGLPAAGKSHLGSRLAHELRWPYVTKDDYKTILHERLPEITNAQSGPLSFELMYHVAGVTLAAGVDTVLETHFYRGISEPRIGALAQAHGARLAQMFCEAPLEVLQSRHDARVASGTRPFIDFPLNYGILPDHWCWTPLSLDAPLLRVDTTGPDPLPGVLTWVRSLR
ncbi:AAA family ATPase [Deinococcus koreensis]|uniref:Kinase n=1 Tax=Deinococcus koreensis TaxID=2054903 RepID=A0A2K3UY65_9DEIO|nr:ATP-binding protein [Deinococcus koreensis]PNY81480.1 hypothetical protein CVO96_08885 [Deinococcus koreensis]